MKNPAVLFYTSDFITGTLFMSNEEVGAYIRILCMQHQKGHLSIDEIKQICKEDKIFNAVIIHFKKDDDGFFFNERMDLEKEKRNKYSESRANNRKKVDNDNTCIYLMLNKKNNIFKIGSSNNPTRRLLEIRNYYKNKDIYLYAHCENKPQSLEKELHDLYKDKWCYDEWYKLNKKDIDNIIKNNDMINDMIDDMINDMENENENINNIYNNIYNNISNNNINNNSNIKDNRVLGEEEKKVKHCYGEFKRVKLTDKEYNKLIEDYGEDVIKEKIKQVDEYVESNNNKNKYTNFNLVIRKAIRNNWFKDKTEEKGYERKLIKDEDGAFHF